MSNGDKIDALIVGAHRDDVEITCGGTVRKLVELGYRTVILDLTEGEMGSRGSASIRKEESERASKILGVVDRIDLGLPDAFVEDTRENRIKVVEILRRLRPHLLIIPHAEQRHPDHRKTPELIYDSCHLSGLAKLKTGKQEPHRPYKILYSTSFLDIKPSFIVDITDQIDAKLDAVSCYKSQFEPDAGKTVVYPPAFDIMDFIKVDARKYGYRIGKMYGEPFVVKESILIDDPMQLQTASI